jgi:hypothetical protein
MDFGKTNTGKDKVYLTLFLCLLFFLDLMVIVAILWKGHANFIEVYKHLNI